MANEKTVLILGGGVGGVVAATRLRQRLPREHRVVLVERAAAFVFQSAFLRLMTGQRTRAAISRPLANLEKRGIEVIRGEVEAIDPDRRSARVNGQELAGDYLVLALGAELASDAVPGLTEAGINLYTPEGATQLNEARQAIRSGHVVVRLAMLVCATPFKCPAAPYEAAMLLDADLRRRGLRAAVAIDLYTPEPGPMGAAGPEISRQVRQMVEAKGIGYHPEHAVTGVDALIKQLRFANGATADFDLLVYVPPHRAPLCAREAGLCGANGWIEVDRATLATRFPGIYAIGDAVGISLTTGKPLPKAAVFAQAQAETVARNIADLIEGRPAANHFEGHGACFLEIGDGRAGFGSGNFYAEPAPAITMKPPGRLMHWAKAAYEKYWLYKWF
ncbi:MAG: FAD/NAD(P)-binding oxidoreductase [Pseudomonadota bacterium]|nr:FAD/NAD(P)-binding oxidoreductase [Pseudomonadota bacterium]MDP1903503.1 FAD/NAD(P)-binding oxidoreductase [Pseudomonadota bacterium]MDP2351540.1 FAD/NAD(P)-binding oxidoreductase [Pseudomonadota bacterium]